MKKSIWIWAALLGVVIGVSAWSLFCLPTGQTGSGYATRTAFRLKNAITAYFTDFQKLPGVSSTQSYDLDLESDEEFMKHLLGSGNERDIVYFPGKIAREIGDGKYKRGISMNSKGTGALWDPWGNQYRIRLDANSDGEVTDPKTNDPISESIIVWSAGKDGNFETWNDNAKTW